MKDFRNTAALLLLLPLIGCLYYYSVKSQKETALYNLKKNGYTEVTLKDANYQWFDHCGKSLRVGFVGKKNGQFDSGYTCETIFGTRFYIDNN